MAALQEMICESAVDMVAAKMAASVSPVRTAGRNSIDMRGSASSEAATMPSVSTFEARSGSMALE
jgi:hypothetical protein